MLRKLLKIFLGIVFFASISIFLIELYGGVTTYWKMNKCRESVISFYIDPSQEKTYQVAIPSFFTTCAFISILEMEGEEEHKHFRPENRMICELIIQDNSGKELLHRKGFYPQKEAFDAENFPGLIHLNKNPASGKIIFTINKALSGPSFPQIKVFCRPFVYFGSIVVGVCKILGTISLVIAIITGIILYKMIPMDRLVAREKTQEC